MITLLFLKKIDVEKIDFKKYIFLHTFCLQRYFEFKNIMNHILLNYDINVNKFDFDK